MVEPRGIDPIKVALRRAAYDQFAHYLVYVIDCVYRPMVCILQSMESPTD